MSSQSAGSWQQFQQPSLSVARLGDIMNVPAEPAEGRLRFLLERRIYVSLFHGSAA
jgi:ABC-type bacteriocin/lantibiotic exporter with double-glycine peptidase domain